MLIIMMRNQYPSLPNNDDFKENVELFDITLDTPVKAKFAGSKTSIEVRATINDNDGDSTVTAAVDGRYQ